MNKKVYDILCFMGEYGLRYGPKLLPLFESYVERMLNDDRVIVFSENGKVEGVIFFSVDDETNRFWQKKMWEYLPHNPLGTTAYIELLLIKKWNMEVRKNIQYFLENRFPDLLFGRWHRRSKIRDREFIVKTTKSKENAHV